MTTSLHRRTCALAALIATLLSLLATSVSAGQVSGTLLAWGENSFSRDLASRTRVILSGGAYTSMITKEGKFLFPNVPSGSYLLEVQSPQFIYPMVKVTVSDKDPKASLVSLGTDWSNNDNTLPSPLVLSPRGQSSYFVPREGFKLSHLLANPMMLMMGFSVLMLFIMPKLMANMDPEAMQEMQEMQGSTPNFEMPDLAATLAKFSAGGASPAAGSAGAGKKRQ